MRRLSLYATLTVVAWLGASEAFSGEPANGGAENSPQTDKVDFVRDIQPILAQHCISCHGPDMQEGGLRLHIRKAAFDGGDSGPVIVPGKVDNSKLITLVTVGNDEGLTMPPETPLAAEQVALLKRWISEGAVWPKNAAQDDTVKSDHWSFQPISRPVPPEVLGTDWVQNPIDRFVLSRLEAEGFKPSPEADRTTLLRRVYLDVLGVPPTPAEVEAFLSDRQVGAYERAVDRLLAAPAYGERWARHWLDLARYADSDGYEKDLGRPHAWRYRHWVIDALNENLPFDRFTIEQLAGDLLPEANIERKVATGFHRNTLTNREGGVDREEDRVKQTVDRTNTTGAVWMGLTVGCAQCHTHKYDPLTQREYYGLYAFFNSLQEVDLPAPLRQDGEDEYRRAKEDWDLRLAMLKTKIDHAAKEQLPARQLAWEADALAQAGSGWQVLQAVQAVSANGATLEIQPDGIIWVTGETPASDRYTLTFATSQPGITGLRLEALADPKLPGGGPGRVSHGNFVLSEVRATIRTAEGGDAKVVRFQQASADFSQGKNGAEWPVAAAIDGDLKTGWAISPEMGKDHVAVFEITDDVEIARGSQLVIELDQQYGSQHTLGKFRVSVTTATRPVRQGGLPDSVVQALQVAGEKRTAAQHKAIADYYRGIDPPLARLDAELAALQKAEPKRKDGSMAQTLADLTTPRTTRVLLRGDFLQPGPEVVPHTPAVLPPLKKVSEGAGQPNRLDLANWIVDPENPLTARVTVNRIWQRYFGQGIVESSHDFGTQGDRPTHPELLDWLASEFMGSGWDLKALHRTIVTSATYRQSSAARPELRQRDPYNKLLARQNRLRVQAEIVRDLALAASGLLEPRVGGESVRPPQPADIAALGYAGSVKWPVSTGADRYRRGLYTFFQRTVPYPMYMDFDSPDSNEVCTRRERSNTPLAALTLQNDPVFVECTQALARRIVAEPLSQGDLQHACADRINRAFLMTLARRPAPNERDVVMQLLRDVENYLSSQPNETKALAGTLPRPVNASDLELATWAVVGRTLLNLDEFITRE